MAGRPTKYNESFHPKLVELLARNGLTDSQISEELEISEATLYTWKQEHPLFLEAMQRGKQNIDKQVESTLLKRALGFSQQEEKPFHYKGEPVIVSYERHYEPDVNAIRIWLMNRCPDRWRDKIHIEDDTDFERQLQKLEIIRKRALDSE